jgi:hypothetical protein
MYLHDHRTQQDWQNTVWPELYGWGVGAETLRFRFNWTFPIHYSRHDPNVLWVASQYLHRSTNNGASWEVVSKDLTRNDRSKLKPSGGPVTRDNTGAEVYCTIFALAESPQRRGRLWCGTDDGLVHRSDNGGRTWTNITPDGRHGKVAGGARNALPDWALISIVEASPHDEDTLYVAATRYKHDDTKPYLYKTEDAGKTWRKITGGIPGGEFTRTIREDPSRKGLLYCGTETAIYASLDDGGSWHRMGGNLPIAPIYDLVVKGVEMVVATHGRSIWILDDLTPLHQMQDRSRERGTVLFKPRDTVRLRILGGYGGVAAQATASRGPCWPGMVNYARTGASIIRVLPVPRPDGGHDIRWLDSGQNPPNGVVVRYWLPDPPPRDVTLTILDGNGRELRRFDGDRISAKPGMNQFLWNRRVPGSPNVLAKDLEPVARNDGPMVVPGRYGVRLNAGGRSQVQSFAILPDPRISTGAADLRAQFAFLKTIVNKLSTVNTAINEIDAALTKSKPTSRVRAELAAIRGKLIDVNYSQSQLWASGLHQKLNALFETVDSGDFAPAQQTREVYTLLSDQLDELLARWRKVRSSSRRKR